MKDKKKISIIVGVFLLVLLTIGVTYAFFSYIGSGTTENTISSDSITFLYEEIDQQGNGISITEATPVDDITGKQGQAFNFRIISTSANTISIPYEINVRKKDGSDNLDDIVKLYLTKVDDNNQETEVELSKYSELTTVTKNNHQEKQLHIDKVPANSNGYSQKYRLRMWIDKDADFSTGNYNDKTFSITVNVYSSGHVQTQEDVESAGRTDITSLSVNNVELNQISTNTYSTSLENGTTETTIDIETTNPYTKVVIEKTDETYTNVIAANTGIQKLSTSKKVSLSNGANYFRIRLTSEDTTTNRELHLKITVEKLAGFFANDDTFISWDELVNTYGLQANLRNGKSVLDTIGKEGKLVLSSSVTTIYDNAFTGSNKLTEIEMTDNVTTVGLYAFRDCSKLETVVLSNSLTSTPTAMFYSCGALKNITLPNSITSIGSSTFYGCNSLAIDIPNSVQSIGESAFANTAVTAVVIPASVTSIGPMAFSMCRKITSITFEDPNNWYSGNQLLDLSNPQTNLYKINDHGCTKRDN